MPIVSTWTPSSPTPDPLSRNDALSTPGVYGAGSDQPVAVFSPSGELHAINPDQSAVEVPITAFPEEQRFRRLTGSLVLTETIVSE